MRFLIITFFLFSVQTLHAQSYRDSLEKHREEYKAEFLKDGRSPLKQDDLAFLRFYEPNESYRVECAFKTVKSSDFFKIQTYDGKTKEYIKYGILTFTLNGRELSLSVYRSPVLMKMEQYKNYLFIPLKDLTSGKETYGGGRYLDIQTTDIRNGRLLLDFNKLYNPYCAFSDGFSCPVPPKENHLPVAIEAGEKTFGKAH